MGSFVISVDAELGWGFHDHDDPPPDRVEAARSGWRTLLDVLERYDVPATWAVVGHLFLEECDGVHSEHPSVEEWFDRERGSWRTRPDLRFGRELVTETLESDVDHDVGCHTFSHVLFDDDRLTREIVRAELEASARLARSFGVEFESFVFPRNAVGYRDLLAEFDFTCYRGASSKSTGRFRRSASKLLAAARPDRVDLVTPSTDEYGLVDVPPSQFLFGFEGRARRVAESLWTDPVLEAARHGIDRASREEGVFHVWLHPNNLRTERDIRRLRDIVAYAAEKREQTDLTVETMADVAARVSGERPAPEPCSARRARTGPGR